MRGSVIDSHPQRGGTLEGCAGREEISTEVVRTQGNRPTTGVGVCTTPGSRLREATEQTGGMSGSAETAPGPRRSQGLVQLDSWQWASRHRVRPDDAACASPNKTAQQDRIEM